MQIISKYFPQLQDEQKRQFEQLGDLYPKWNERINLISRKDIDNLYTHHILHSLVISMHFSFKPNTKILDAGTGGGFPGIPLAILLPDVKFHLVDATLKKIKAVEAIKKTLELKNVTTAHSRLEEMTGVFDFIVARALMPLPELYNKTHGLLSNNHMHSFKNGYIILKGGNIETEIRPFKKRINIFNINNSVDKPFFHQKKIVYLSI